MKTLSISPKRIGLYAGVYTGAALIAYFLLMRLAGLVGITELRLFNFVILLAGISWSMKQHADATRDHYNYFNTLANGCETVIAAVAIFAVFIFIYLSLDHATLATLKESSLIGNFLTPETAAIGVFAEGASSGMILAYIGLSYIHEHSHST